MIKISNFISTTLLVFFFSTYAFSQHYDIGYNTNYFGIYNLNASKYRIIKTVFSLDPQKKIKRVFNNDGKLIEELVFVNGDLVSGIEYFINSDFPFLKVPRSFKIEEVRINHNMSKYYYKKFSSSVIKYLPESQEAIFKLRIYNHDGKDFYILDIASGISKLYFK